ncbi:hypothetical protein [Streptomyces sp. NPDC006274]|uniref:hypothetical protein n=1 Tax=unclassified Streptomyces TaxID=2593676 RepID=UPI0033B40D91
MADSQDEMMEHIAFRLSVIYTGLVACCEALPLPISLPTGAVSNLETVPAVRRVSEIAEEVPIPEDHQAQLFTAAILWLAAMDLYGLLVKMEYSEPRAHGALAAMLIAHDAVTDLAEWLHSDRE